MDHKLFERNTNACAQNLRGPNCARSIQRQRRGALVACLSLLSNCTCMAIKRFYEMSLQILHGFFTLKQDNKKDTGEGFLWEGLRIKSNSPKSVFAEFGSCAMTSDRKLLVLILCSPCAPL